MSHRVSGFRAALLKASKTQMTKRLAPGMKMQEEHPSANKRAVLCFIKNNNATVTAEMDLQTKKISTLVEDQKIDYYRMTCCGGEFQLAFHTAPLLCHKLPIKCLLLDYFIGVRNKSI